MIKIARVAILATAVATLPLCAFAQTSTVPTTPAAPVVGVPATEAPIGPGGQHEGRHPEIHKALHHLDEAKNELEHAAHDYEGHREQALQSIEQARAQLQAALQEQQQRR